MPAQQLITDLQAIRTGGSRPEPVSSVDRDDHHTR